MEFQFKQESRIQLENMWYVTENGDGSGNLDSWDMSSGIELGRINFGIYKWKECVSIPWDCNLNLLNPVTAFTIQYLVPKIKSVLYN